MTKNLSVRRAIVLLARNQGIKPSRLLAVVGASCIDDLVAADVDAACRQAQRLLRGAERSKAAAEVLNDYLENVLLA